MNEKIIKCKKKKKNKQTNTHEKRTRVKVTQSWHTKSYILVKIKGFSRANHASTNLKNILS